MNEKNLIVKNLQRPKVSLEVKKATWPIAIKIFTFYEKILASEQIIDKEHIDRCHKQFKELLFNVKPEILCDNIAYGLAKYIQLYSSIQFKILKQDKKINFLALNSYSQKTYLEQINKKIDKEKSQLIMLCGDEILAEYCDNALKACLKYEINHQNIVRILNQYVKIKEKVVSLKPEEKNFKEQGLRSILHLIINSNLSFEEICELYQVNINTLKSMIKRGKALDYPLFEQAKCKLEEKRNESVQAYSAVAEKILTYCQNGINYDNQNINFTILDYYCITLESPNMIWYKASLKYRKNNWNYSSLTENYESPTVALDVFKSYKRTVDGIVINQDMIDDVYEFLVQNEIPVTFKSLDAALTRYVRGIPILPLKNKNLTLVLNKA